MYRVLYAFFGVVQEFVLQNLIVNNLRGLIRPLALCALVAAALFSLSHLPGMSLSALALVAAFFFTLLYQRHPHVWAVGIAHGLLAAMVFYLLMGEDPGARILQLLSRVCESAQVVANVAT